MLKIKKQNGVDNRIPHRLRACFGKFLEKISVIVPTRPDFFPLPERKILKGDQQGVEIDVHPKNQKMQNRVRQHQRDKQSPMFGNAGRLLLFLSFNYGFLCHRFPLSFRRPFHRAFANDLNVIFFPRLLFLFYRSFIEEARQTCRRPAEFPGRAFRSLPPLPS